MCCTVWCGVSGGNRIREALRIVNGPFLSLNLFSFLCFSNGVWFYLLFLVFPFLGCLSIVLWFLDSFAFLVHFLCTGLCFFNILLSYLSKKKNIIYWGGWGNHSISLLSSSFLFFYLFIYLFLFLNLNIFQIFDGYYLFLKTKFPKIYKIYLK